MFRPVQGVWGERMLMFGNCWSKGWPWTHPRHIPTSTRWFYLDNPQLPHLLYRGEHNPLGFKNWCRMVEGSVSTNVNTPRRDVAGSERINQQLDSITRGKITSWTQLVGTRRDCVERGSTVLLCPPSAGVFRNYYNTTGAEWCQGWRTTLEERGYRVQVRSKPHREARENNNRLYQQLDNIAFTVSIHSVSAVESILAGVPAVVSGDHPAGAIGTPAQEFLETNQLRTPCVDEQDAWVEQLLQDTFHKQECYDGSWY